MKKLTRLLAALMSLTMVGAFTGCGDKTESSAEDNTAYKEQDDIEVDAALIDEMIAEDPDISGQTVYWLSYYGLNLYDPTWIGSLNSDGSTLFFAMADWAIGTSNVSNVPEPVVNADGVVEENDLMVVPFPKQPDADEYYLNTNFGARMFVRNSDKGDAVAAYIKCERLAAMIDEYKEASREKALIPEYNAQGKLKSYLTEEQYDAVQEYKDPSNITPVFDFGFGMGTRMYSDGEYTYETRGVMNNLTNALLNGEKESWTVIRDEWTGVIDEVIDEYNNQ